jgi:SAM-dependent methyltransferase
MRTRFVTTEAKEVEYYRDIRIHADTGLHEQAFDLVVKHAKRGGSVLDVGAGAGALAQRLADADFRVTGLDVDPSKWIPKDIPFLQLDVDKGVRSRVSDTFDMICCLEVIEHVENPWNLLRDLRDLLNDDGRLIISTPNVTSFLSRALFLLKGTLHSFDENGLTYGHINPLTEFEIVTIAGRIGLDVLEVSSGGYLPVLDLTSIRPKSLLFNGLRLIAYLLARGRKEGWCLFFVMRRAGADTHAGLARL